MAYRNKTYVCFDGDSDIHYYRLMQAWHQNDRSEFSFYNAHDINYARDSSLEASIKNQLRQRLLNSMVFVVLVGEKTRYLTKFVKWEMEQAISLGLPLIAVNLNGMRQMDVGRCPSTVRDQLCMHISFNPAVMQYALENWPGQHVREMAANRSGAFFYGPEKYRELGL